MFTPAQVLHRQLCSVDITAARALADYNDIIWYVMEHQKKGSTTSLAKCLQCVTKAALALCHRSIVFNSFLRGAPILLGLHAAR